MFKHLPIAQEKRRELSRTELPLVSELMARVVKCSSWQLRAIHLVMTIYRQEVWCQYRGRDQGPTTRMRQRQHCNPGLWIWNFTSILFCSAASRGEKREAFEEIKTEENWKKTMLWVTTRLGGQGTISIESNLLKKVAFDSVLWAWMAYFPLFCFLFS